ncbi:MAG: tRNA (adenosine(37)-N6)-threonylcarbamoyltransferase complex transferase subunit TsaD [Desulfurococcales archaeon]|nr:tRNA (adenosine(37)-N6)-threonylcarbamoyltransferase complex transferase subunit TsaD [Desulfurococcales archaeon]
MENAVIQSLYNLPRERNSVILGIESTAHTLGIGIVSYPPFEILSDIRFKYNPQTGGLHPRLVTEYMVSNAGNALEKAITEAGIKSSDIDGIAVALGPGIGPQLRVGATLARALALSLKKPLIPVNHAVAHIEIGRLLCGKKDPLVVYISGGNTQLIVYKETRYRVVGETLDIALGNLLDIFSRETGIAPPYIVNGRHAVDICAEGGSFIRGFPYTVKGQDISYSGLLTAALRYAMKNPHAINNVCYTLREIAFAQLIEASERALTSTDKKEILMVGGVAANDCLHGKYFEMSKERRIDYCRVDKMYAGDNGVMIAWTGVLGYLHGLSVPIENAVARQRWRIDEVGIPWMP